MPRRLIANSLGAFTLLLSAGAYAQSVNQATVPFAFTAGNVDLPAGNYVIQQKSENRFISIVDVNSGKVVFASAPEREPLPMDAPAKLIFHRYGNQHFLAAVWSGGGGTARIFSPTSEEKQSRAHLVASNPTESHTQDEVAMK